MASRFRLAAALVALLSGCSTSSGSSSSSPPAPGSRAPWCPATVPTGGTPCTPGPDAAPPDPTIQGVTPACEYPFPYGNNPHCTTIATCSFGTWSLQQPDRSCYTNPSSCPADFDAGNTDMCANELCTYAAGRCSCNLCSPFMVCSPPCRTRDSGTEWYCQPWDEPPGCPDPKPLLGTACTDFDAGTQCGGYWDVWTVCAGGYWGIPVYNGGC